MATFLFAGGGTGGHLFPGIAVALELLSRDASARIVFAGSERVLESSILKEFGFQHVVLPVESSMTARRNPWKFVTYNLRAYFRSAALLRKELPVAVIGLGGFASLPIGWAATKQRIPTVILEQNAVPGRATRALHRRVTKVCVTHAESLQFLHDGGNLQITGNPVRREIAELADKAVSARANSSQTRTLLILGGSQGAQSVNEAVLQMVTRQRKLFADWHIVHQTGEQQAAWVAAEYQRMDINAEVQPFLTEMSQWYRQATVAISRAGATTLSELACAGVPSVLIPYPHAVDDHQTANAQIYVRAGGAKMVLQDKTPATTANLLADVLGKFVTNRDELLKMQRAMHSLAAPQAAQTIANIIGELTNPR